MTNREIAEIFRQIAAVYQLTGKDLFRVRAYENAAVSIEAFTTPLKEIWAEGKLDEVPGIGASFAQYLKELFTTGKVKHFEALMKKAPAGMFPLLEIPGVGPKTAWKLSQKLHLTRAGTALSQVTSAIRGGKIKNILSSKMAAKIQAAIRRPSPASGRMLLWEAETIAGDIITFLKADREVIEAVALGSLRRRVPTVGDIDIAVCTKNPQAIEAHLKKFPHLRRLISAGEKMIIFEHSSGRQVDIKTSLPQSWGDMLVHYTGSKLHNIHLRTLAQSKGMSVSEFGVETKGKKLTHTTEKELYTTLGLAWIPPELREDNGEIEAAQAKTIPTLLELSDIKGDLHVHAKMDFPSSHDMGEDSLEVLLDQAVKLGYVYLGVSDHSPKQSDLSPAGRLAAVKQRKAQIQKEISRLRAKHTSLPKVLVGLEVDIRSDGSLSLEDESMELLDYAIVSIHSQFGLSEREQTQRILRALSHPKAVVLGHPTTRHLLERDEIHCDWQQIFAFCAKQHKLLEINAAINRLDLPFPLIKLAGEMGCRFVINTDAHRASDMTLMRFGVDTARKGWATKTMIANTKDFSTLESML